MGYSTLWAVSYTHLIMGMINTAMTDWLNAMGGTSKVLLGAIVAGMMSIDMGGLFNKAAYVFGTAALASGNYEVMAAVMVGGIDVYKRQADGPPRLPVCPPGRLCCGRYYHQQKDLRSGRGTRCCLLYTSRCV